MGTTVGLVATVGSIALVDLTIDSISSMGLTVSALMLNVETRFDVFDIESKFSLDGVESVESVESRFNDRFYNDMIAGLRLCAFNTVCCICLMRSSSSLGRSLDLLVSALGFAPSLPGQN